MISIAWLLFAEGSVAGRLALDVGTTPVFGTLGDRDGAKLGTIDDMLDGWGGWVSLQLCVNPHRVTAVAYNIAADADLHSVTRRITKSGACAVVGVHAVGVWQWLDNE